MRAVEAKGRAQGNVSPVEEGALKEVIIFLIGQVLATCLAAVFVLAGAKEGVTPIIPIAIVAYWPYFLGRRRRLSGRHYDILGVAASYVRFLLFSLRDATQIPTLYAVAVRLPIRMWLLLFSKYPFSVLDFYFFHVHILDVRLFCRCENEGLAAVGVHAVVDVLVEGGNAVLEEESV